MNLTQLSIKRPSAIIVIFSLIAIFGILTLNKLGTELLPDMSTPIVVVTTEYPGAAPSEVENQITKKIEDGLSSLNNIDYMSSKSLSGASIVMANFKIGTNVDVTMQEAQRNIDKIRRDLPADSKNPTLVKNSPGDLPIMMITVNSNLPKSELYQKVKDDYLPVIQQVKGVSEVNLLGGEKREVRVNVNKDKLNHYGLSILQITQAVNSANLEFPTGKIKSDNEQLVVKLAGKFESLDDLRNLVVFGPPSGTPVRVNDVAEVKDGIVELTSIARYNGENGMAVLIKKSPDGNTVDISDKVTESLKIIESENKESNLKFTIIGDDSVVTNKSVNSVIFDLILAVLLVAFIMYVFMHNIRNSIIVVISIPISLISAFIMMNVMNYSLNLMTLLAMTLVIGILVDDSIVVLENIQRHMEMGKDKITATYEGIKEITFAAVTITIVIVVVFLPLTFMQSIVSEVMRQFALTVAFTTLMSLFSSLTLTVFLSSRFAKIDEKKDLANPVHRLLAKFERLLQRGADFYGKALDWALSHKTVVFGILIALFAATVMIMKMGILGQELMASGDQGKFRMTFEFSKNTTVQQNNLIMQNIEQRILSRPEVKYVFANVGGPKQGLGGSGFGLENESELTIQLKDGKEQIDIPTEKYMENLRNEISEKYPGVKLTTTLIGIVDLSSAAVEIILLGDNYDVLFKESEKVKNIIDNTPGAIDSKISVDISGNPELSIDLDNEKMSDFGLTTAIVGGTIQNALSGNHDSKYRENGIDYDIRINFDAFDRKNPDDLREIQFLNKTGGRVQLSQFANVQRSAGPNMLERYNRRTSITITANNLGRSNGLIVNDIIDALKKDPIDPSVMLTWGRLNKTQDETFASLGFAILLSIIMIYFILVILFDNFLYPLAILFSIPASLVGSLLALNLSMSSMSIFSLLGILMLLGLVAKNAILIVDFYVKLKQQGMHYRKALIEAGKLRMRPILMTTIAMIFGMIPVAIAKGADAEWKNGLAFVLIGGLLSAMIITVILIPVLCYIIDTVKEKFARKKATEIKSVQTEMLTK